MVTLTFTCVSCQYQWTNVAPARDYEPDLFVIGKCKGCVSWQTFRVTRG